MRFLLVRARARAPRALCLGQVGMGRGGGYRWRDWPARASVPANSPSSHLCPAATQATASRSTIS